jgi:hypothetical protein
MPPGRGRVKTRRRALVTRIYRVLLHTKKIRNTLTQFEKINGLVVNDA